MDNKLAVGAATALVGAAVVGSLMFRQTETTVCAMADGQKGCTVPWAYTAASSVYSDCIPGAKVDTPIERKGDKILFRGRVIAREDYHCDLMKQP